MEQNVYSAKMHGWVCYVQLMRYSILENDCTHSANQLRVFHCSISHSVLNHQVARASKRRENVGLKKQKV
jgi:hypothetical protein